MSTMNPASPTLTWGQSFGFDGFGNSVSQSPTAGSAPRLNMTVNTATNQLTATGVQYDSNGNLINNGSSAFTFDFLGRLKTALNSSYTYSAGENKRIAVYYPGGSGGGTMTFYLYGPDGRRLGVYQESSPNGNWNWANVSRPSPQTFQYLGGKPLNYSEERLSSNGNRYYPYGQAYSGTAPGTEMPAFGTYVPDQGSGMLYADQRYYNAAWGRFLTPDPSDKNIDRSNPISWNRYSYINGDPLNGNDRTGLYLDDNGYACLDVGGDQSQIVYSGDSIDGGEPWFLTGSSATFGPGLDVPIDNQFSALFSGQDSIGTALNGADGMMAVFSGGLVAAGSTVALGEGLVAGASSGLGIGTADGAGAAAVAPVVASFFEGTTLSQGVLEKTDLFHSFPEAVAAFEDAGTTFERIGGDGSVYTHLDIPSAHQNTSGKWLEGAFEFIKDDSNTITHWFFRPK